MRLGTYLSVIMAGLLAVGSALAREPAAPSPESGTASIQEPLYDNLGHLTWPVSTDNELAQKYFDQGMRWAYAFNHSAARRSFQQAQRLDPECAMCYWGEAYVLGPNINAPMPEEANPPALAALEKAKEKLPQASEREQALIRALSSRYSADPQGPGRAELDQAYASAMKNVHQRFPEDHQIGVLYADAVMNTTPWDYWQADGSTPKGEVGEAIRVVEGVLAEDPEHVGAIHFYIHLTEASADPHRAAPYAERLADLMPGAGHIVHMGSHTFYRIGRFQESMAVNQQAVAADKAYFARSPGEDPLWRHGYYPHNIHFTAVSALMAGDFATALEYADQIQGKVPDEVAREIGWIQLVRQAPYLLHAHLDEPEAVLAIQDPGDGLPFVRAMWHYARGTAFARQGAADKARQEVASIAAIRERSDLDYPDDIAPVVPDVLRIAELVVEGRIAQNAGDWSRAARQFEQAAEIQATLPYLEPPFWYYPVSQSLGAALIRAGQPEAAEKIFIASLEKIPNNGWALFGLMEAQQAQGKKQEAERTRQQFDQAWAGKASRLTLERL